MRARPKAPAKPKKIHKQIENLKLILRSLNLDFAEEFRFHPVRQWRFDLAVPALKLAIEYQGHGTTGKKKHVGGHASIGGLTGDCEKLNAAQALGWRVLKFTALYFRHEDRVKHGLNSPFDTLKAFATTPLPPVEHAEDSKPSNPISPHQPLTPRDGGEIEQQSLF